MFYMHVFNVFYKSEKTCFYVFYLQSNVFNIYGLGCLFYIHMRLLQCNIDNYFNTGNKWRNKRTTVCDILHSFNRLMGSTIRRQGLQDQWLDQLSSRSKKLAVMAAFH